MSGSILLSMGRVLIKNGLVVDADKQFNADVLINGEKIERVAPSIPEEDDMETVDASGMYVMPGMIDAHTHYHLVSRGTVTADSFIEGSRLAAFGGVTTVIDFADDNKISLKSSLDARKAEMKSMAIDYALHQGVYKYRDDISQELAVIKDEGIKALKIFTTYRNVGYLVEDRNELKAIFKDARDLGMMITVHAEDDKTIEDIAAAWDRDFKPASHADLRPADAEAKAILYVGHIAAELGMPIYIVHLSSRKGLEAVRQLRSEGVEVIVETTPTYLFLDRSLLEREDGSLFIMTPPLRTKDDNKALLEALVDGEIQIVATDHCSFTYAQKLESDDCRTVYPGIPGTEELLPLLHTFSVETGRIGINDIVRLLSRNPAHYFSLYPEKGSLEAGTDADIIIFNPHEEWTLSSSTLHSASGYTAYDGRKVIGKTMRTYLRGRQIVSGSEYYGISGEGHFIASRI